MQNLKELRHLELSKINGGGVTPPKGSFFNPDGKTNPYDMALGGTTYPHQGACPLDSYLLGYIGGGQNLCRKRWLHLFNSLIGAALCVSKNI